MTGTVKSFIRNKGYLLGDGAMGTRLFSLGLKSGESPEIWNMSNPQNVEKVHNEFILSGSDIILTNSFGGNRLRLKLHDAQEKVRELNIASATIGRKAADAAHRNILVAGSIGPCGEFIEPLGGLSLDEATEIFSEQATALRDGGADILWIETMSSIQELRSAVNGALSSKLPIIATMSFDTAGKTMMGVSAKELITFRKTMGDKITAIGANCGVGPATLISTICELAAYADNNDILVAKANCGIPEFKAGKICYSGTPDMMQVYARLARDSGARIIGGCCGTSQNHIKKMARVFTNEAKGPRPDKITIEARLGRIDSPKSPKEKRYNRRRIRPTE